MGQRDSDEESRPFLEKEDVAFLSIADPTRCRPKTRPWSHIIGITLFMVGYTIAIFMGSRLFISPERIASNPLPYSPLNDHTVHEVITPDPDAWNEALYMGEPTAEGEAAWDRLVYPRIFKLLDEEAIHLNAQSVVRLKNDDGYPAVTGIYHNLHCLRSVHEALFPDFYYQNMSEEDSRVTRLHVLHCMEVLRQSVLCNPDTTVYPLKWTYDTGSYMSAMPNQTQSCVRWDRLHTFLKARPVTTVDIDFAERAGQPGPARQGAPKPPPVDET